MDDHLGWVTEEQIGCRRLLERDRFSSDGADPLLERPTDSAAAIGTK